MSESRLKEEELSYKLKGAVVEALVTEADARERYKETLEFLKKVKDLKDKDGKSVLNAEEIKYLDNAIRLYDDLIKKGRLLEGSAISDISKKIEAIRNAQPTKIGAEPAFKILSAMDPPPISDQTFLKAIHELNNNFALDEQQSFKTPFKEYLETYKEYASIFSGFSKFMIDMRAKHPEIASLEEQLGSPAYFGQRVIMPIQRVPRYELLLKEIIKELPPSKEKQNMNTILQREQALTKGLNEGVLPTFISSQLHFLAEDALTKLKTTTTLKRNVVLKAIDQWSKAITTFNSLPNESSEGIEKRLKGKHTQENFDALGENEKMLYNALRVTVPEEKNSALSALTQNLTSLVKNKQLYDRLRTEKKLFKELVALNKQLGFMDKKQIGMTYTEFSKQKKAYKAAIKKLEADKKTYLKVVKKDLKKMSKEMTKERKKIAKEETVSRVTPIVQPTPLQSNPSQLREATSINVRPVVPPRDDLPPVPPRDDPGATKTSGTRVRPVTPTTQGRPHLETTKTQRGPLPQPPRTQMKPPTPTTQGRPNLAATQTRQRTQAARTQPQAPSSAQVRPTTPPTQARTSPTATQTQQKMSAPPVPPRDDLKGKITPNGAQTVDRIPIPPRPTRVANRSQQRNAQTFIQPTSRSTQSGLQPGRMMHVPLFSKESLEYRKKVNDLIHSLNEEINKIKNNGREPDKIEKLQSEIEEIQKNDLPAKQKLDQIKEAMDKFGSDRLFKDVQNAFMIRHREIEKGFADQRQLNWNKLDVLKTSSIQPNQTPISRVIEITKKTIDVLVDRKQLISKSDAEKNENLLVAHRNALSVMITLQSQLKDKEQYDEAKKTIDTALEGKIKLPHDVVNLLKETKKEIVRAEKNNTVINTASAKKFYNDNIYSPTRKTPTVSATPSPASKQPNPSQIEPKTRGFRSH